MCNVPLIIGMLFENYGKIEKEKVIEICLVTF